MALVVFFRCNSYFILKSILKKKKRKRGKEQAALNGKFLIFWLISRSPACQTRLHSLDGQAVPRQTSDTLIWWAANTVIPDHPSMCLGAGRLSWKVVINGPVFDHKIVLIYMRIRRKLVLESKSHSLRAVLLALSTLLFSLKHLQCFSPLFLQGGREWIAPFRVQVEVGVLTVTRHVLAQMAQPAGRPMAFVSALLDGKGSTVTSPVL